MAAGGVGCQPDAHGGNLYNVVQHGQQLAGVDAFFRDLHPALIEPELYSP